ncbi:hypothetical protein VNI00_008540 [Paramarasmius palmivorus]|uniref:Uncharacterized protein n=1 Tax=Paramarasmius palmivorus TaxID=297713 RepID=A0AAW0CTL3_9AGAR
MSIRADHVQLDTISPIILPNLRTLGIHIHNPNFENLQRVLDCINAPRLVGFYVGWRLRNEYPDPISLFGFLERSGCTLRSFALETNAGTPKIIDLLTSMPSLEQFQLYTAPPSLYRFSEDIFRSLTPRTPNADVPCPNLESVVCRGFTEPCAAFVLAFAEARNAGHPAIRRLKRMRVHLLPSNYDPPGYEPLKLEEVTSRLEALRMKGMSIEWDAPIPQVVDSRIIFPTFDSKDFTKLWWQTVQCKCLV